SFRSERSSGNLIRSSSVPGCKVKAFAPALKSAEALKSAFQRSDADAGTLRPTANAPGQDALAASARRIKRNIRRRF
ncbi:MAG: hypothetical protein IJZ10_06755, partial [Thermoguttaceae bacterium]|nr:hypothetical protein [Thermoguttaceae bacterium]